MSFTCCNTHTATQCKQKYLHTRLQTRKYKDVLSYCVLSLPEPLILLQILWKCNPWCIWQPLSFQHRSHRYQHHTKQLNITQTHTHRHMLHYKMSQPHAVYCKTTARRKTGLMCSPNDDTLILSINHHVSVHVISQGVDMRWVLILGLQGQRGKKGICGQLRPMEY